MESKAFHIHREDKLVYLTIPAFDKTRIVNHCFSTKMGGVSEGIYESMNVSFGRGDLDENVMKNLDILCHAVGIDYRNLVFSSQVHEDLIQVVGRDDRGKGIDRKSDIIGIDGLMTDEIGVPIHTTYADCVPLYFLDPVKRVIALSHAGWRGTVKKIGAKTVKKMIQEYGSHVEDILVCIAPSIGPCCFEVGEEVAEVFMEVFSENNHKESTKMSNPTFVESLPLQIGKVMTQIMKKTSEDKYMIDLWTANKLILLDVGILPENITVTDICTKCNHDFMFSHRATEGKRGSLAAIMELKP